MMRTPALAVLAGILVLGLFLACLLARADKEEALAASSNADAGEPATSPGRQVFIDRNCALCHTVYSAGIGEAPEGWSAGGDDSAGGDNSAAGDDSAGEVATGAEIATDAEVAADTEVATDAEVVADAEVVTDAAGSAEPGGPPDLSVLGRSWTAELLRTYLVHRDEIDGAGHVTSFKGDDDEWEAVSAWMLELGATEDTSRVATPPSAPSTEGEAPDASDNGEQR